jgi:hypothetical protein
MCFSASASFGASLVLSVIGVATIKNTRHREQLPFASIPFVFAVQQFSEGVLWLTLPYSDYVATQKIATYFFLFFAQIVWPILVPIAILLLEKRSAKIMIQKVLVGAGLMVGLYLAYCLLSFNVEAKIVGHHIKYSQDYPVVYRIYSIALYGLATIIPSFFSHIRRMWILGLAILVSYIIAAIFYTHYILSVWCFFAAILSVSLYVIMLEIREKYEVNAKFVSLN